MSSQRSLQGKFKASPAAPPEGSLLSSKRFKPASDDAFARLQPRDRTVSSVPSMSQEANASLMPIQPGGTWFPDRGSSSNTTMSRYYQDSRATIQGGLREQEYQFGNTWDGSESGAILNFNNPSIMSSDAAAAAAFEAARDLLYLQQHNATANTTAIGTSSGRVMEQTTHSTGSRALGTSSEGVLAVHRGRNQNCMTRPCTTMQQHVPVMTSILARGGNGGGGVGNFVGDMGSLDSATIRQLLQLYNESAATVRGAGQGWSSPMPAPLQPVSSMPLFQENFSSVTPLTQRTIARPLPFCLSCPETDPRHLSKFQVFLRLHMEAFGATVQDTASHTRGRHKPLLVNQVGIRCRHCAHIAPAQRTKGSTYFPASILGFYQAAQNMCSTHLQCGLCPEMPESTKTMFAQLLATKTAGSSSSGGRAYWGRCVQDVGQLVDTEQGVFPRHAITKGIRILELKDQTFYQAGSALARSAS